MTRIINPQLIKNWISQVTAIFENLSDVDCPHVEDVEKERAKVNRALLKLKKEMEHFYNEVQRC